MVSTFHDFFLVEIKNISELLALFSGLFTVVITALYFTKPKIRVIQIKIEYCIFKQNHKIKATIVNCNRIFKIVDIFCEISLSKTKDFDVVRTLPLVKSHTLSLSNKDLENYTFISDDCIYLNNENNLEFKDYNFIRVKLLAPNILGIKKAKTIIVERKVYIR